MIKSSETPQGLKVFLKEGSYVSMAVLTVLWTGFWSLARKHPFLTGFFIVCLFVVIGIIAGPDKKPLDIYDIERLPRYSQIRHKFGRDLTEESERIYRRELYTWIRENGTDTWWFHEYYPLDIDTEHSHVKSEQELSDDALCLNDLIQRLKDESKNIGWRWNWKSKKGLADLTSYEIDGDINESFWLKLPLKHRHEFMVSIYKYAALKTGAYSTVNIVDNGRWLGMVEPAKVVILLRTKKE